MNNTFNHLHLHTRYSLNDAMIKAKDLAKKCKEYGMNAVAITEHGHMMNMPEAYLALKDEGIKLVVGMEAYVSTTDNKMKKDRGSHLVLLCENNTGYQNLMKIASDAAVNGFYYNPRTDKHKLRLYHEGLIASSACLGGSINKALLAGDYEAAKKEALEYQDIFGKGNFFLEIQRHGLPEQDQINPMIIKLSKETGIPLIATNDSHYINPEDWEAHDIQMAIQAKTTVKDTKRKVYGSHEFYFKSQEQMCELFKDIPEACENTVKIAERCNVEIDFKSSKLPPFKLPNGYKGTNYDLLREETLKGLEEIFGTLSDEALERMNFELGVVDKMGFVNYFLITWDLFRFCREGTYEVDDEPKPGWKPILTGPGRGCFLPGSKVCLYNGDAKNIEDIEIGDIVVGEDGCNRVYARFEYDIDEEITHVVLEDGVISCTNDHKILMIGAHGDIMTPASALECGDKLRCIDNSESTIVNIYNKGYKGKVYDLGVENNPSYNVSGRVVHNSGAGSLMLYGLGITKIDPLKHDLLFQRFLNPDRISMPDYCIVPSYSNVCRRILLTLLLRGVALA